MLSTIEIDDAGLTLVLTTSTFSIYAPDAGRGLVDLAVQLSGATPTPEIPRGKVELDNDPDILVVGSISIPLAGGTQEALRLKANSNTSNLVGTSGGNWVVRISPAAMGVPYLFVQMPGPVATIRLQYLLARSLDEARVAAETLTAQLVRVCEAKAASANATPALSLSFQHDTFHYDDEAMASYEAKAYDLNTPGAKAALAAMGLGGEVPAPTAPPVSAPGAGFPALQTLRAGDTVTFTGTVSVVKHGRGQYGPWHLVQFLPDGGAGGRVVAFLNDRAYAQIGALGTRYSVTGWVKGVGPDKYSLGRYSCDLAKCKLVAIP